MNPSISTLLSGFVLCLIWFFVGFTDLQSTIPDNTAYIIIAMSSLNAAVWCYIWKENK